MIVGVPVRSERLIIREMQRGEWLESRPVRLSADALEFDHPDHPIPSVEEEIQSWESAVVPGQFLIFALVPVVDPTADPLGFICAFDHDPKQGTCETGVGLFLSEHRGRGLAFEAYRALLPELRKHWKLEETLILTHPDNAKAIALYSRLGFQHQGLEADGADFSWARMVLQF